MTVLIITHGPLPDRDCPVSGVALRAEAHRQGLLALGHHVYVAQKAAFGDDSGERIASFQTRAELRALTKTLRPDVIVAVAPEEIPAVSGLKIPIVADLYAPRILEAQYEEADVTGEIQSWLNAVSLADGFLVSNERQVHYIMGLLPLSGLRCEEAQVQVVPLSAPTFKSKGRRGREARFVTGGVMWPWQNPRWAVQETLNHLGAQNQGNLVVFGGQYLLAEDKSPLDDPLSGLAPTQRLSRQSFLPYGQLLDFYAKSHCALDVMQKNPERALALSFRQMDWLGCGLPIITGSYAPIAEQLIERQAGWIVDEGDRDGLRAALDMILEGAKPLQTMQKNAKALAKDHYSVESAGRKLDQFLRNLTPRQRKLTPWVRGAERYDVAKVAKLKLAQLATERDELRRLLSEKSLEIRSLNTRIKNDSRALSKLAVSLETALSIRRLDLGQSLNERDEHLVRAAELRQELLIKERELAGKQKDLKALRLSRESLQQVVAVAEAERAHGARAQLAAERKVSAQEGNVHRLEQKLAEALDELALAKQDLSKKSEDLKQERQLKELVKLEVQDGQAQLKKENARLLERKRSLMAQLEHATASWKALESETTKLRAEHDSLQSRLIDCGADVDKKDRELSALQAERQRLNELVEAQKLQLMDLQSTSKGPISALLSAVRSRKI